MQNQQPATPTPTPTYNSNERFMQEMAVLEESLTLNLDTRSRSSSSNSTFNPPTTPTATPIERTETVEQTRSEGTASGVLSTGWTNMYQIRQHSNVGFFDLPDR